jgi:putative transcriptional regulator
MVNYTHWLRMAALLALAWQSAAAQEIGRGSLLISTDALDGTIFEKTVLLIVHHDEDGSIGIMINRPTNLTPAEVFPDIEGAGSYTGVLYFGGPLTPGRPLLIARRSEALASSAIRIADDVYLSGDASLLRSLEESQRNDGFSRIYAGSAQWGPGQLQGEVEAGAWEVALASPGYVFTEAPEALWPRLLNAPHGTDTARQTSVSPAEVRVAAR